MKPDKFKTFLAESAKEIERNRRATALKHSSGKMEALANHVNSELQIIAKNDHPWLKSGQPRSARGAADKSHLYVCGIGFWAEFTTDRVTLAWLTSTKSPDVVRTIIGGHYKHNQECDPSAAMECVHNIISMVVTMRQEGYEADYIRARLMRKRHF